MKRLLIAVLIFNLVACTSLHSHEKMAQQQAATAGLVAVAKPHFNATFVAPSAVFSRYKNIIINDLDLSQAIIVAPGPKYSSDQSWTLTDDDKRFYQARFSESAKRSLLDSGLFAAVTMTDVDTLLLKTKITEIAPHASKDDIKSRPNLMDVYSEGFGRMTIVFELYDATTHELIMLATDQHDLGKTWEKNNRVQNNLQIRLAFDFWLNQLKRELIAAEKR